MDRVIADALGEHIFERFVEAKTEEWDEYGRYDGRPSLEAGGQ